jgi:hypothetical protein
VKVTETSAAVDVAAVLRVIVEPDTLTTVTVTPTPMAEFVDVTTDPSAIDEATEDGPLIVALVEPWVVLMMVLTV